MWSPKTFEPKVDMNKPAELPVLLIPVYRGGAFFREAVNSIKPCLPWFRSCVISINGKDATEDRRCASSLAPLCQLTVLETGRDINAMEHIYYIADQLAFGLGFSKSTQIFILCHDDLLAFQSFQSLDMADWRGYGMRTISLGDYISFQDGESPGSGICKSSFPGANQSHKISRSSFFLMQNTDKDPFTNISGMRMSLDILLTTLQFYHWTGSRSGMRMEYALTTNKRVQTVINHCPPLVKIRSHPNSEGSIRNYKEFIASELRYALWLWLNCTSLIDFKTLLKGRFNIKKIIWLTMTTLKHRYYEQLGNLRSMAIKAGLCAKG